MLKSSNLNKNILLIFLIFLVFSMNCYAEKKVFTSVSLAAGFDFLKHIDEKTSVTGPGIDITGSVAIDEKNLGALANVFLEFPTGFSISDSILTRSDYKKMFYGTFFIGPAVTYKSFTQPFENTTSAGFSLIGSTDTRNEVKNNKVNIGIGIVNEFRHYFNDLIHLSVQLKCDFMFKQHFKRTVRGIVTDNEWRKYKSFDFKVSVGAGVKL